VWLIAYRGRYSITLSARTSSLKSGQNASALGLAIPAALAIDRVRGSLGQCCRDSRKLIIVKIKATRPRRLGFAPQRSQIS
jgi:hypothetical protein